MNASKCCVLNCNNTRPDTTLHKFPDPEKELDRFNRWIYAIGGNVLVIDSNSVFKNGRVCHSHFNQKFNTASKRLSKNAVPSLFLSGVPLQKFPNLETFAERFQVWVKNIGGDIASLDSATVFKTRRICRRHFEKQYLYPNNRLSKLAIPTLLLPSGDISATTTTPLGPDCQTSTSQEASLLNPVIQHSTAVRIVEHSSCSAPTTSPLLPDSQPSTSQDALLSIPVIQHSTAVKPVENKLGSGLKNMDSFKLKLKNVVHSTKYCGICLENDDNMSTINENLEIIVNERTRTKALKDITDVVFKETYYTPASSLICNSCVEKLIQSYIFIENAKETSKILDNYINDLFSKSDYIFNHLPESSIERTSVVIVLENIIHDSSERKNEFNKMVEKHNEIFKVKKEFNPNTYSRKKKKFKCAKCLVMLPSLRALKVHRMKCKKQILQCRLCFKTLKNKQHLNVHYKLHLKVKCKFCPEILLKKELLDHFKTNHGDSLLKCLKCELFYSLKTFQSHIKVCRQIKEDKPQCLMCLKTYTEKEFKSHTCRYSCPECTDIPCMHYKYLKSYREQTLNNENKIKCVECDYVCTRKENLLGHVNKVHLNNHPYTCDKCGQQFYSKVVLKAHILRFHENCFVCTYCDSEFSNINNYESHVISCEDIKRKFACDSCPASFDSSDSLMNHIKRRHSTDIFPCGLCNKKFLKDSKRKEHMVKVHSSLQIKKRDKNVECVVCQEKFDNKGELVQHMKSHGPHTTYPCRICNTEYQTLRQFRAHNRKHNGPFATCHVCGKQMREILLKKHLTTHSDSIETCETCGRSFQNITLLKYHQKVHLESVPCPKCKKMINPARLRRHWRGHLMEENPAQKGIRKQQPNLKCEQCEYKTWNNTLLECHMNRHHLKIKPYVCHICSKDFIGKHLLKKHIETHDMKSVVCMVCLKSFANSTCLKMHLRLHTGEKPFTCEICGDRFRSSSIMNVHKLKKHSGKSYICPLCSNKFYTVRDLRRHVIKVHWKQKNKRFDPRELKGLDKEHYHLFHDGRRVKVADEDVDFHMPH